MSQSKKILLLSLLLFLMSTLFLDKTKIAYTQSEVPIPEWLLLSTTLNNLSPPSASKEQTSSLILDIDKDGQNDFVIGIRRQPGPSLVWYQRNSEGWTKYIIDNTVLPIEAGGAYYDIDRDGDLDVVMGADNTSNQVWWWENPYPTYEPNTGWTRRLIKNDGGAKHHDQMFGDFDGDGEAELVFWNQHSNQLILAKIPADPRNTAPWPYTPIYTWQGMEHEGLAQADIDGDGVVDIVGGGRWFKRNSDGTFTANLIDDSQRFARAAAGQLKVGGRPEVVFGCGDCVGPLKWYEWDGTGWIGHNLLEVNVDHGHSLQIADSNGDGHLDIFNAEMRLGGGNPAAKMRIFYGKGDGSFLATEVAAGYGNHESKLGDLDGDGDLDILGKPYDWETPRLDIWLNQSQASCTASLDLWQRHVIDETKPWRSLFIAAADLDGDQDQDIVTGGWWYENPGTPGGAWTRHPLGTPLHNMAALYDFDGNGTIDVLGTGGKGAESNASFVWGRNDGAGNFTILSNIQQANGNFLQGVAVDHYQPTNALQVALSWHDESKGIQMLTVPADPVQQLWGWRQLSPVSQGEALTNGDLDRDGDVDLLLGTTWLRNDSTSTTEAWQAFPIHPAGDVDRNRLADINGDGRVDAVVGYEAASVPGKLAWYEQPVDASSAWIEHLIAMPVGPMSLDVRDLDSDGDWDLVVGEHNLANPANAALWVYENIDGKGGTWREHLVYRGDEHHDGAQIVDIDDDGDFDIISIGWDHNRVLLYENRPTPCQPATPVATPSPTVTASPIETPTPTVEPIGTVPPITTPVPPTPQTPIPPASCLADGLLHLYTFREGSGAVVKDVAHPNEPLDLLINDLANVTWLPAGGLSVNAPVVIRSQQPATQIVTAGQSTNAFSIIAWIAPTSISPSPAAHIVTLSQDSANRNFTLGQGLASGSPPTNYFMQVRTTSAAEDGLSSLTTPAQVVSTTLTHFVYTHDAAVDRQIYVNGVNVTAQQAAEALFNWDPTYHLALANDGTGEHPWLGTFYYIAVYDCALTAAEITNLYRNGAFLWPNQLPHPVFEAVPLLGDKPNTVYMDASRSLDVDGTIQQYTWQWGDGAAGEGMIAEHTYPTPGAYRVTLTVTDDQGATASSNKMIQTEETVMQLYFPMAGQ